MASPASAPAHNVFVYGSLMSEEVVGILLGRVPPSSPVVLPNHRRFSIRGRVYPAILPVDGDEVSGKLFTGLTDGELDVDIFEDERYTRETVAVSLADSSETIIAYAYIWRNVDDPDLYGEWDFYEWKKEHLKDYLTMTQDVKDKLEQLEPKTDD